MFRVAHCSRPVLVYLVQVLDVEIAEEQAHVFL